MSGRLPNPATDSIRRFFVESVERQPHSGMNPVVVAWRVCDRTGFLPDEVFEVETPANARRPGDDAIAAALARAVQRRRDLNFCEAFGHLFDVLDERCATCGVQP